MKLIDPDKRYTLLDSLEKSKYLTCIQLGKIATSSGVRKAHPGASEAATHVYGCNAARALLVDGLVTRVLNKSEKACKSKYRWHYSLSKLGAEWLIRYRQQENI